MAQSNLKQPMSHSFKCLPPLSPFHPSDSSLASSNSNLKDVSMEGIDVSSCGPPMARNTHPPRVGHRRANSDVPLGFSDMMHSSPQLVPIGLKRREMDMVNCVDKKLEGQDVDGLFNSFMNLDRVIKSRDGGEISCVDLESVSRHSVKRSGGGDIDAPPARHYRSLSMDSAIMGNFHLGDESPQSRMDQLSPSDSLSDNSVKVNFDFGHGEFNEIELKKIMADERLAEIAASDPKRAKRILANRQSAARSKERKTRYISELEYKVQTLQTEATTLSTQVTILQKDYAELTNQNNELKFRVQAMEQQAQLRDALHEALTAEVQRLKLAKMDLREDGRTSNGVAQPGPMKHHMFQMQRS